MLAADKFPLVLGGEHSLTVGAVRPLLVRHSDLVVLQFDAHADLRDGYLGERYSHAAAMRRVLDNPGVSLVSLGIRAISAAEAEFIESNRDRITIHWAKDQAAWDEDSILQRLRETGESKGYNAGFSPRDRSAFLGALDQAVRRALRSQAEPT